MSKIFDVAKEMWDKKREEEKNYPNWELKALIKDIFDVEVSPINGKYTDQGIEFYFRKTYGDFGDGTVLVAKVVGTRKKKEIWCPEDLGELLEWKEKHYGNITE